MAGTVGQTKKEVIIDFSILNQDAVKTISDVSQKIENLKRQQKLLEEQGQKNTETYIKNAAAIRDYNAVLKANEKELDNNIKAQRAEGDSLNAMRADLRSLISAYSDLTKEEREGAKGTELLNKIDTQRAAVEDLEHKLGDYGRQVGNYGKAVEGLGGPIGKAVSVFQNLSKGTLSVGTAFKNGVSAVKAFSAQMIKLLANPIVAAIAAIAAVVMKLVDAFKKNDDAMTALQSAFAGFQPIINAVNKAFEWLVSGITKALNGIAKLIAFIGGDASKAEQEQVKRIDELEDAERQYTVEHAKNDKEVAELRDKAMDREKYTAEERKKFIDEAIKIEERDAQEKKRLAKERYEIAKKEAKNNADTSDETKNRLAELEAAMHQADKEYADTHRSLLREQNKFQKELNKEAEDAQKEREQKAKEWAAKQKERQKIEKDETRKAEDMAIAALTEGYEKQRRLVEVTYDRQIEDIKKRLETEKNLTVGARKALNDQLVLLQAKKVAELGKLDENYNDENLRKEFNYQKKLAETRIAGMQDGFNKQMELFKEQRKQLKFEYDEQLKTITDATEKERLEEIYKAQIALIDQREAKLKESTQQQINDLIGVNALQQQLYDIEVDAFGNKESRKAELMQQEAENRLQIAKTEQQRLHDLLQNDPTNADLQLQYEQATASVIEAQNQVRIATQKTTAALQQEKAEVIGQFTAIAGSLNNVLGAFNDMFTAMAESNEKYQKFATAMAISQIYVSMAASIAQAVQAAVQAGGFTGPAAPVTIPVFIAELVAIVASTIGSTISTLNKAKSAQTSTPKFADGGLVGTQTTERIDDSVNAKLSYGEYVINSKKVKEYGVGFFDRINYGKGQSHLNAFHAYAEGGYVNSTDIDAMRLAFASVIEDMPNPVVLVKEITNAQNRVRVKENL